MKNRLKKKDYGKLFLFDQSFRSDNRKMNLNILSDWYKDKTVNIIIKAVFLDPNGSITKKTAL
jgi:hypothetical protein